jgi:hypothetical protein
LHRYYLDDNGHRLLNAAVLLGEPGFRSRFVSFKGDRFVSRFSVIERFLLTKISSLLALPYLYKYEYSLTATQTKTTSSELPDSIKRVGNTSAFPNEYTGQIYAFNWCLNGDGVTPLRRSAFRITKPLDLKVAGLTLPKKMPLQVSEKSSLGDYIYLLKEQRLTLSLLVLPSQ